VEHIAIISLDRNNRIKQLQEEIDQRNRDNKYLKEELQTVKNNLIMHYHDLLMEGRDTR
jgi:hypothetical protein